MCVWVRNIGGPDLVQNDIQLMQLDVIAPAGPALRNRFRHPGDIITPMAGRGGGAVLRGDNAPIIPSPVPPIPETVLIGSSW